MIAKSLFRLVKKLTTRSISSREAPAVDAIIGLSIDTALSNTGQSVNEQLAILTMSKFWSSIMSNEFSSNEVDIVMKPFALISAINESNCSLERRVSAKRLMYLISILSFRSGWIKVSKSRYCNLKANLNWGYFLHTAPNALINSTPWTISPM